MTALYLGESIINKYLWLEEKDRSNGCPGGMTACGNKRTWICKYEHCMYNFQGYCCPSMDAHDRYRREFSTEIY
jgi:hypothetical protein